MPAYDRVYSGSSCPVLLSTSPPSSRSSSRRTSDPLTQMTTRSPPRSRSTRCLHQVPRQRAVPSTTTRSPPSLARPPASTSLPSETSLEIAHTCPTDTRPSQIHDLMPLRILPVSPHLASLVVSLTSSYTYIRPFFRSFAIVLLYIVESLTLSRCPLVTLFHHPRHSPHCL